MFEHLDDPQPFVADERLRTTVLTVGGRLRRRRRQALGAGVAAAAVGFAAVGSWAYVERRDAAIDRIDVATQPSTDGAVNVLLLGDDAALGDDRSQARIDTAVLARIDDAGVHLLSIPRDLADPQTGQRFAHAAGGDLQAAVDAVHAVVGDVPIDHVLRLDFEGFVALVDAVGGIPVRIDRPIVDEPTGTDLEPASCAVLDGDTALGLVRARHVHGDSSGDLGRTARQRALLQAALAAVDATEIDALSRVLADHALVDDRLDLARIIALGRRLTGAPVEADVLPVATLTTPDGAAVLRLTDGSELVLARFGASTPAAVAADATPVDPGVEPGIAACSAR